MPGKYINTEHLTLAVNSKFGEGRHSDTNEAILSLKVPDIEPNTTVPMTTITISDITNKTTANNPTGIIVYDDSATSVTTITSIVPLFTPNTKKKNDQPCFNTKHYKQQRTPPSQQLCHI